MDNEANTWIRLVKVGNLPLNSISVSYPEIQSFPLFNMNLYPLFGGKKERSLELVLRKMCMLYFNKGIFK